MINHNGTEKITEKEWTVLLYFIERQSICLDNAHGTAAAGGPVACFMAYPAKIERDLNREVTRGWAAEICVSLEDMGLLGHEMIRPPRQRHDTEHYFIKSDFTAIRRIIRIVMDRTSLKERLAILSFRFFLDAIDEKLVLEALYEKGAEMRRTIGLLEWDEADARRLFRSYLERERGIGSGMAITWEEHMVALLRGIRDAGEPWSENEISLRLPVFPGKIPPGERERIFGELNRNELDRYPFVGFGSSGIRQHYERHEYETLILPLLTLARASPGALDELLNGAWKPSGTGQDPLSFTPDGIMPLEHLMFSMLFIAISDLAATRLVPEGGSVSLAWLRRSNNVISSSGEDALLTISLSNGMNVYFDAGFDTVGDLYDPDSDTHAEPRDDLSYWVRTWTGPCGSLNDSLLFRMEDIMDPHGLITRLSKGKDLLACTLSGRFSSKTQRLLACYDMADDVLHEKAHKSLLGELNRLIIGKPLYDRTLFRDVTLRDITRKMVESSADSVTGCTLLNRHLLCDAFSEYIKS